MNPKQHMTLRLEYCFFNQTPRHTESLNVNTTLLLLHFAFRVSLHVKEPISSWTTPAAFFFSRATRCAGTDAAVGSVAAALGSTGRSDRHLNRRPAALDGPSSSSLSPCPVLGAVCCPARCQLHVPPAANS